jgi:excisionase family DNA binding protein
MAEAVAQTERFPAGEWFDAAQVCNALKIPKQTFYRWRTEGKGPRAHVLGRHLRFSGESLNEWLAEQLERAA